MKKKFTKLVILHAADLQKYEMIDVEMTWYCKNKRRDKDNIMAGQKFIFDGLVEANVIKNDGWAQIGDVSHLFKIDKDNPRVEIQLREV